MATALSLASFRCARCQLGVLELFTGLSIRRTAVHASWTQPCGRPSMRLVHQSVRLCSEDTPVHTARHDHPPDVVDQDPGPDGAATPWYLRNQGPIENENPFAHRQRMPDIPPNPPPILEPLLKHLSIDIGLDYLNILDLRHVDPPPAFGANLLMIIGTARSERHLNVSADRLCRWLRSTYKLTPYADGLLGRNELKLKLRRRARRAKVLGAVGASDSGPVDDGTTTGWVCVNVGEVDGPPDDGAAVEASADDFVGFGKRSNTAKIVIQMMTEEKRGDLDLETLWQGVLRGSIRRHESLEDTSETLPVPSKLNYDQDGRRQTFIRSMGYRAAQTRGFSTASVRRITDLREAVSEPMPDVMPPSDSTPWSDSTRLNDPDLSHASDRWKTLVTRLKALPHDAAMEALGEGEDDTDSTHFLKEFNANLPLFRDTGDWQALLAVQHEALRLGHARYSKHRLWQLFVGMDESGVFIPPSTSMSVLSTILLAPHALHEIKDSDSRADEMEIAQAPPYSPRATRDFKPIGHTMHMAFDVLERTLAHGHAGSLLEVLLTLHRSISVPSFGPGGTEFQLHWKDSGLLQLHYYRSLQLIFPKDQPLPKELVYDMLRVWGDQRNWRGFWRLWRDMALEGTRRDGSLYALLFQSVARDGSQKFARIALTDWWAEMEREVPPVPLDAEIAVGVLMCLRRMDFDPRDQDAGELEIWRGLWDRCWKCASLDEEQSARLAEQVEVD